MVIAQIAPAVRVAIAETVGLSPGDVTVGQLVTGLRKLGFDYVFGGRRGVSLGRVLRLLVLAGAGDGAACCGVWRTNLHACTLVAHALTRAPVAAAATRRTQTRCLART
jgi:hypothetical protein